MNDTSQLLADKIDAIMQRWMEIVRQDRKIESAMELSDTALGDSLPKLLQAMVSTLSRYEEEKFELLVNASLEHGIVRAQQGYDSDEIAREYGILRRVIFSFLESLLLESSPAEIIRTFRLIDAVLDEAIQDCFQSYVHERMQELQQVRCQLTLTNRELTRLLRASKENLSYMAHELKTPLTSIIGYSELFLRQQRDDPKPGETSASINHFEKVLRGGRHLLHIVNEALEFSRLEAGKIELRPGSTDLRSIINDTIEIVKPVAQAKGLELQVDCDRAPLEVFTDCFRFQQILTNLLSNAVRYTNKGYIRLECQTLPEEKWSISVTDTGIGIEPKDQKRIFAPYLQASFKELNQAREGTGLGLAIVARFVKLLQGEIKVSSAMGVGSTFTVILPLKVKY